MTWVLLMAAIALEVTATLSLKASDGFTRRRWIAPVVLGYLASFGLIAVVLARGMAVGVVYGIWVACGVALTAVLGRVIFGEPLTRTMRFGIALIIGGVLLIELGSVAG